MSRKVVIVSAVRTPIGSFMGSLSGFKAQTLGAIAMKAAVERINLDPKEIEEVIVGHIAGTDPKGNPGREAMLEAGLPIEIPAYTVNKNCASSIKSASLGAALIQSNQADCVLVAGMECMSNIPYVLRNARKGMRMGNSIAEDLLSSLLEGMGMTAERLAEMYNISREEQDAFALRSHQNAAKAVENKLFQAEIVPIEIKTRNGTFMFDFDEGIKRDTTIDVLKGLKPVFKKDGSVTAGNASTINDAGAALILMSEEKAKNLGLKPLAEIVGFASAGCDPDIMGIGPVPATKALLRKLDMTIEDFDMIELNEAFAAQSLAVIKELNLNVDKVNVNGGAIALGHPTGATGAVLLTKLVHAMNRDSIENGLITLCIGGGQGMSIALKKY